MIYTDKKRYEYILNSKKDNYLLNIYPNGTGDDLHLTSTAEPSIWLPEAAPESAVTSAYINFRNRDLITCSYSYTNLTEYSDENESKYTCETVNEINNKNGVIHVNDIGFSRIKTLFYENTYYHTDTAYYLLKVIYPTYLKVNLEDYFKNNPNLIYEKTTDNGIHQIIDCTETFDDEYNVVPKTVFVRFPDKSYIDYTSYYANLPAPDTIEYKSAFSPNYIYNYELIGIEEQAISIFNSSTGTLSLKSEYINNNASCKISCHIYKEPNNFFNRSDNDLVQEYLFKKLLPMKYEIPNNTYEVYLNEELEDLIKLEKEQDEKTRLAKAYSITPLTFNFYDADSYGGVSLYTRSVSIELQDLLTKKIIKLTNPNGRTIEVGPEQNIIYGHTYKCIINSSGSAIKRIIGNDFDDLIYNNSIIYNDIKEFDFTVTRFDRNKCIKIGSNNYFGVQSTENFNNDDELKTWIEMHPDSYIGIQEINISLGREQAQYIIVGFRLHDGNNKAIPVTSSSFSKFQIVYSEENKHLIGNINEEYLPVGYKFANGYIFYKIIANHGYKYEYSYKNTIDENLGQINEITFDTIGLTQATCGRLFGNQINISFDQNTTPEDIYSLSNYIYIVDSNKTAIDTYDRRIRIWLYYSNSSWFGIPGQNQSIPNGIFYSLEGHTDNNATYNSTGWETIGTSITSGELLEFNNTNSKYVKYKLTLQDLSDKRFKFLQTAGSNEYSSTIINLSNSKINKSNKNLNFTCRVYADVISNTFKFFDDNYITKLLTLGEYNKLNNIQAFTSSNGSITGSHWCSSNTDETKPVYWTYAKLSHILNITGLWDIWPSDGYSKQFNNNPNLDSDTSDSRKINLNNGSYGINFYNTGYFNSGGQQDINNVYFWAKASNDVFNPRMLAIKRNNTKKAEVIESKANNINSMQCLLLHKSYGLRTVFDLDTANNPIFIENKTDVVLSFTEVEIQQPGATLNCQQPTVKTNGGEIIAGLTLSDFTFKSSNIEIAEIINGTQIKNTVNTDGEFVNGEVTILVEFKGNSRYNKASGSYNVRFGLKSVSINFASGTVLVCDKAVNSIIDAQNPSIFPNIAGTKKYYSDNVAVAEINETTGKITLKGSGGVLITVKFFPDDNKYASAQKTYTLNVSIPQEAEKLKISIQIYNGAISNSNFTADKIGFVFEDDTKYEVVPDTIKTIPYMSSPVIVDVYVPTELNNKQLKGHENSIYIIDSNPKRARTLVITGPDLLPLNNERSYITYVTSTIAPGYSGYESGDSTQTSITITFNNQAAGTLYITAIFIVANDGQAMSYGGGSVITEVATSKTVSIPLNSSVQGKKLISSSGIYVNAKVHQYGNVRSYQGVTSYDQNMTLTKDARFYTTITNNYPNFGAVNPFADDEEINEENLDNLSISNLDESYENTLMIYGASESEDDKLYENFVSIPEEYYTQTGEFGAIQVEEMPTLYLPKNLSVDIYRKLRFGSTSTEVANIVYFDYDPETGAENEIYSPEDLTIEGHQLKPKLLIHNVGESTISVKYKGDDVYGLTLGTNFKLVVKKKQEPTLSLENDKFEIIRQPASTIDESTDNDDDKLSGYQTFQSPTPMVTCDESIPVKFEYFSSNDLIGMPYGDLGIIIINNVGTIKVTIKLKETKKYRSSNIYYQLIIQNPPEKTLTILETEDSYYKVRFRELVDKPVYRIYDLYEENRKHLILEINSKKEFKALKETGINLILKHKIGNNIREYLVNNIRYNFTYNDGITLYEYNGLNFTNNINDLYEYTDPLNGDVLLFDVENISYDESLQIANVKLNCNVVLTPDGAEAYYIFNKALTKRLKNDANSFIKSKLPGRYVDYHLKNITAEDFLGGIELSYPTYSENFETYGVQILNTEYPELSVAFRHATDNKLASYIGAGVGQLKSSYSKGRTCKFYVRLCSSITLEELMVKHNYNDDDLRYQVFKCPFTSNNTDEDVEYSFSSSVPTIANPNSNGNVVIYNTGKVKIMIQSSETENFTSAETGYILDVVEKEIPILETKYNKYIYEMDTHALENVFGCPEFTWNNTDSDAKLVFWIKDGGAPPNEKYLTIEDIYGVPEYDDELDEEMPEENEPEEDDTNDGYTLWLDDNQLGNLTEELANQLKENEQNTTVGNGKINLTNINYEFYGGDGITQLDPTINDNTLNYGAILLQYIGNDFGKTFNDKSVLQLSNSANLIDGNMNTSVGIEYNEETGEYTVKFKLKLYPVFSKNLYNLGYFLDKIVYNDDGENVDRVWCDSGGSIWYAIDNKLEQTEVIEDSKSYQIYQCYSNNFIYGVIYINDDTTGQLIAEHRTVRSDILNNYQSKMQPIESLCTLEGKDDYQVSYVYYDIPKKEEEEEIDDQENPSVIYNINDEDSLEDGLVYGANSQTISLSNPANVYNFSFGAEEINTNTEDNAFIVITGSEFLITINPNDWLRVVDADGNTVTSRTDVMHLADPNYIYLTENNTGLDRTISIEISDNGGKNAIIDIVQSSNTTIIDPEDQSVHVQLNITNNSSTPITFDGFIYFVLYDEFRNECVELVGNITNNMLINNGDTSESIDCVFSQTSTQNPLQYINGQYGLAPYTMYYNIGYNSNAGFRVNNQKKSFAEVDSSIKFGNDVIYPITITQDPLDLNRNNEQQTEGGDIINDQGQYSIVNFKKSIEIIQNDKTYKVSIDDGGNLTIENGLINRVINVLVKSIETDNFKPIYQVYNVLISSALEDSYSAINKIKAILLNMIEKNELRLDEQLQQQLNSL